MSKRQPEWFRLHGREYEKISEGFSRISFERHTELLSASPTAIRDDEIFRNNPLNNVKIVDACKLANYELSDSVKGPISDLHYSLGTDTNPATTAVLDYLVDHKYCRKREPHGNTHVYAGSNKLNHSRSGTDLRCILCHTDDF